MTDAAGHFSGETAQVGNGRDGGKDVRTTGQDTAAGSNPAAKDPLYSGQKPQLRNQRTAKRSSEPAAIKPRHKSSDNSSNAIASSERMEHAILDHRIRGVLHSTPTSVAGALIGLCLAIAFLWGGSVDQNALIVWFFTGVGITVFRLLLLHQVPHVDSRDATAPDRDFIERRRAWLRRFAACAMVEGLWWMLPVCALFLGATSNEVMMVAILVIGLSAGAAASYSVYAPAAYFFTLPSQIALCAFFVSGLTTQHLMLAVLVVAYVAVLARIIHGFARVRLSMVRVGTDAKAARDELRIIADNSWAMENWVGPSGRLRWASPSSEALTGYTPEELCAMDDFPVQIVHPDDRPHILEGFRRAQTSQSLSDAEFRLVRKDGSTLWCAVVSTPAEDASGNRVGFRASVRDISENKKLQQNIEEARSRLLTIANYSYSWEIWMTPEAKPLWISPSVERITGYTPEECYAMDDYPYPLVHEDDRGWMRKAAAEGGRLQENRSFEFRVRRKDGGVRWCMLNSNPAYDEAGKMVGVRASMADITEMKQLQGELKKTAEDLSIIADYSYAWELWWSPDNEILWQNPAVTKITGYTPEEYLALDDPMSIIIDEDRALSDRHRADRDRNEKLRTYQCRIRRKDGEIRWIQVEAQPALDRDGNSVGMRTSIRDITDLKNLEAEREKAAAELKIIADYSYAWEMWWSPEGEVLWVNPAVEQVSGYTADEFMALDDPMSLVLEEDRDAANHSRKGRENDESLRDYQCRIRRKDGEVRWVQVQAAPAYDNKGAQVGFRSSIRDITRLKALESELRQQADELRIITEFSQAWELWFDTDGSLRWVSPSVEAITGYSRQECHMADLFPLPLVHDDDRARMARALAAAVNTPTTQEVEFRIVRKDGEVIWCGCESRPAFGSDGEPMGFRASVRDITRQKTLQDELERIATTDSLTGINNRRQFFNLGETELYRAVRYGKDLSIAMIDIDHFKKINDTFGHNIGDECLKAIADCIGGSIRRSDIFARLGGEEFVIMMTETSLENAAALMDRLREKISRIRVPLDEGTCRFTASIGVAGYKPDITELTDLLHLADEALYESKDGGRNRVTVALADGGRSLAAEMALT